MPGPTFNIGRDARLVVVTDDGAELRLNATMFTSQQATTQVQSQPLNDYMTTVDLPQMWTFSFAIDRDDRAIDDYFAQREARFFAGGRIGTGTVYAYIQETNGSTSAWEYGRATLRYTGAGQFQGDEKVSQTIEGTASWRRAV